MRGPEHLDKVAYTPVTALRRVSAYLCVPLVVMVFLSFSPAAYAGLALLSVVSVLEALRRNACRHRGVRRHRLTRSGAGRMAAAILGISLAFIAIPGMSIHLTGAAIHLDSGLRAADVAASGLDRSVKVGAVGALLCIGAMAIGRMRRPSKRVTDGGPRTTTWWWSVPLVVVFGLMATATPDVAPYFALLFGTGVSFRRDVRMEGLLRDRERGHGVSGRRPRRQRRYPGGLPAGGSATSRRRIGSVADPNVAGDVADGVVRECPERSDRPVSVVAPIPASAATASGGVPVRSWSTESAGALDLDLGSMEAEPDRRYGVERSSGSRFEIRPSPLIVLG